MSKWLSFPYTSDGVLDVQRRWRSMSTTQIELDTRLLAQAAEVLGTKTKKDTVNEALKRVVQDAVRRRHVDELAGGALPDLADPAIMASAWR
jgi:Arc/MetJ family transcription regulator